MINHQTNRLVTLLFFTASIAGFWLLQQTTLERLGSLLFLVAVGAFAFSFHRSDILGACALYFSVYDVNQWLFNQILPIWLGVIATTIFGALIWLTLFSREGWYLAVTSILVAAELILALQYINIEAKLQSLIIVLPFILACQFYYFGKLDLSATQLSQVT